MASTYRSDSNDTDFVPFQQNYFKIVASAVVDDRVKILVALMKIPFSVILRFLFNGGLQAILDCRHLTDPKCYYEAFISKCSVSLTTTFDTKDGEEEDYNVLYPVIRRVHPHKRVRTDWIVFEPRNYEQLASHHCRNGKPIQMNVTTSDGCSAFGGRFADIDHTVRSLGDEGKYLVVNCFWINNGSKKKFGAKVYFKRNGDVTKLHVISITYSDFFAALVPYTVQEKEGQSATISVSP
jgi:hypothetical protein